MYRLVVARSILNKRSKRIAYLIVGVELSSFDIFY